MKPKIKICCISSKDEAKKAISMGAAALGLVGKMPSGPGPIEDHLIKEIAGQVPPPVATFLLTSETSSSGILNHHRRTQTNTIQIVDKPKDGVYNFLKQELPNVKIVQVIHITDDPSIDEALFYAEKADALLLDSGNPNLKVKELGGTGRTHDWEISRKIVEQSTIPVFLAGGLNAENVKRALDTVQPFGLDICSGVRTNGQLDQEKLENFIKNAFS